MFKRHILPMETKSEFLDRPIRSRMRQSTVSLLTKSLLWSLGFVIVVFFLISLSSDIERKNHSRNVHHKTHHRSHKHKQNFDSLLFHPVISKHERKANVPKNWVGGSIVPAFFRKNVKVMKVNCNAIFRGSVLAVSRAKHLRPSRKAISNSKYNALTKKCVKFKEYRNYITSPLTKKEFAFPIAYSIIMKKSVYQFETLLRAIYRPQNSYCIHIDKTAHNDIKAVVTGIANCFRNVFILYEEDHVAKGKLSHLRAELSCMKHLLKRPKWKYFINLSEKDFPLKTNNEIVNILTSLHGANDVSGEPLNSSRKEIRKLPPGVQGYIGSGNVILNRETVNFAVNGKASREILSWAETTADPQKVFYSTLNFNEKLKLKGTFKGIKNVPNLRNLVHIAKFVDEKGTSKYSCHGTRAFHNLCTFGVGDLPFLAARKEMFAYRFRWDFDHLALQCLEQMIHQKSKEQFLYPKDYDMSYYRKLDVVHFQVT